MGYRKFYCSRCLRIVVIFLALSSSFLVSNAILESGGIKPEKGCDGLAEVITLPNQGRYLRGSSRDRKKLFEVREVIGTIKADYPGTEAKRQAIHAP
ncbi:hypothetical protein MLD38_006935 [Melastoma candidum]|uniref:Uncharacterized protein n=1 Tax=Melastoma candidum TaxID=119954 RepID=A0ACB9RP70_9MYRT|nr:hypothetical protein MLD38_006935 [Melastoma candidum]